VYLIDTNVVSELRRPHPDPAVVAWIRGIANRDLFLSAVTIGELQAGVEQLRPRDESRANDIERWVGQIATVWNILPMDAVAFRHWGLLMHDKSGELIANAMIAATAHVHNLTVVTRNLGGFLSLGVPTLDPFAPV
jgi:toxin FitB